MENEKQVDGQEFNLMEALEEFTKCAQRTILPFNKVAYETILGVVELALVREVVSNKVLCGTGINGTQVVDYTKPQTEELDEKVFGIIDEVHAELEKAGDAQ